MADPVYVALDFETADYQPDSACAVGLAKVRGGEVVDTLYSLIRPPRRRVLFTWVHGITWKDVQGSPTFLEFWPQMASFLQGVTHLVAHNAPFDRRVLEACCQSNGIALPDLPSCARCGSRAGSSSFLPTSLMPFAVTAASRLIITMLVRTPSPPPGF